MARCSAVGSGTEIPWERNFYAIFAAQVLAIAGFGAVSPILPFYVQSMGVDDPAMLKIWVGFIQTSGSAMVAVFAPIWGRLGDCYGRRLMLLRAMIGGTAMMVLMGLSTSPWQLVIFRAFGGIFTGTVTAATVLVATTVPKNKVGYCLGMLQSAVLAGSALGPVLGGAAGDFFGYRVTFFVTALLLSAAALVVLLVVREEFHRPPAVGRLLTRILPDFSVLRRTPEILALIGVMGTVQLAAASLVPILPLFILSLAPGETMIGSLTGLIVGMRAFSGAFAAALIGRVSDRLGYRRVMLVCLVGGFLSHIPLVLVTNPWQLLLLRVMGGFFLGGTIPSINALIALRAEPGKQGTVYGLSSSVSAAGAAAGPAIGAVIAAAGGYTPVFLTTAGVLAAAAVIVAVFVERVVKPRAAR